MDKIVDRQDDYRKHKNNHLKKLVNQTILSHANQRNLHNITSKNLNCQELINRASPFLEELANELDKTLVISKYVAGKNRWIYESKQRPISLLTNKIKIGDVVPALSTASGKAILAHLDEKETKRAFKLYLKEPNPLGKQIYSSYIKLLADLELIKTLGFSYNVDETVIGTAAIATPIFKDTQTPLYSLSIICDSEHFNPKKMMHYGQIIKKCSEHISQSL